MPTPSRRQRRIASLAPAFDPRHIEAFMRDANGALDRLSPAAFDDEVFVAAMCIRYGGEPLAEQLAQSFGL